MFNPQSYENSRPDGIPVLEIVDEGKERSDPSQPRRFVPLKRTEIKGEVIGPLAALRLIQTYGFTQEHGDQVIEACYRFPLPGDAAVTSVRVRFGQIDIKAELKERTQAESDYQEAKQQGRQAAMVRRESPDVFTLQVAGIQPDQDVLVETAYVQLARAESAGWSIRIPLTTSPRYVRSDEKTARHAQGQPLLLLRDSGHRVELDLLVRGAGTVVSSTHKLEVAHEGDRKRVQLQEREVLPDRDFVLSWQPAQTADRPALQVWLHDDRSQGQVYFLALVASPATLDRGRGISREVVLLIDHSGSMEGAKWQAADWAVERFLSDLTERDSIALGLFHNTTRWLSREPQPATPQNVTKATQFLNKYRDSGGTELGVALEQALHLKRSSGELARHVLVITDAEVTDTGRILRLADEEAKRLERRRISVLCIDAAPNSLLATELAEQGGGVARFMTSQPDEEDITTALDEVLADWAEPVLIGMRLEVNRPQVEVAGRELLDSKESGWSAIDLGDLPAGRPVWVAGRVPRGDLGRLVFRVRTAKQWELAECRLDLPTEAESRPALKALFGARRIRGLEHLIHSGFTGEELNSQLQRLGYDPALVLANPSPKTAKVYAENARSDVGAALRSLLVREALDYGLASAETAFIAVRAEAGKPVEDTVWVANALPTGWSETFAGHIGGAAAFGGFTGMIRACASPPPGAGQIGDLCDTDFDDEDEAPRGLTNARVRAKRSKATFGIARCSPSEVKKTQTAPKVLFTGVPQFVGDEAVLFDSVNDQNAGQSPNRGTIEKLIVSFPDGAPDPKCLDAGLCMLFFLDDLASPRARIRLVDIIRQRGERPLNLRMQANQVFRIVLVDPSGLWSRVAPRMEIALCW